LRLLLHHLHDIMAFTAPTKTNKKKRENPSEEGLREA
jgi:hypothetical protein